MKQKYTHRNPKWERKSPPGLRPALRGLIFDLCIDATDHAEAERQITSACINARELETALLRYRIQAGRAEKVVSL